MMPTTTSSRLARAAIAAGVIAVAAAGFVSPARLAYATPSSPTSMTVGVGGAGPSTASFAGSGLMGPGDNGLGAPLPVCQAPGCDSFTLTLVAPGGYAKGHVITLKIHVDYQDTSPGSVDVYLVDSGGNTVGAAPTSTTPADITASGVTPGTYTIEVAGGPAVSASYNGTITASAVGLGTVPVRVAPTGGLAFGRETIADPTHLGTEPSVTVSPDGTVYESPIFGSSTTTSFVDRSTDGGKSFVTMGIPGAGKIVGTGKGAACDGGGDSDLTTDQYNDLYENDLGEVTVAAGVSNDHGVSWTVNCIAGQEGGRPNYLPDRQWLSTDTVHQREWFIYRDGLQPLPSNPTDQIDGGVYGEYVEYAPLPTAAGSAALSQVTFSSLCTTSGVASPCESDINVAGAAVTDNYGFAGTPRAGTTYLAQRTNDGIGVLAINPSLNPPYVEHTAVAGVNAVLFPSVAVDHAGNLYEVYVDDQTFQVMYTHSADQGATWSPAVAINAFPARTAVMPWIVAGDAGRVDVVYYGSPTTDAPPSNFGPWNLYMMQSLNATSAHPMWSQQVATDRPNHLDPVCLSGLGCTTDTGTSGDRELGDFFKVTLDNDGRAVISFADGNNQLGAEDVRGTVPAPSFAHFVRQSSGPSLNASVGTVPKIDVPTNSVSVAPYDDPVPASGPAGAGASNDALELLKSSVDFPDATHMHIHLVVRNLDATTATTTTAGPIATYLTRWWYGGNVYAAGAEVNPAGQWSYFAGQPVPLDDGLAIKYAYYPATSSETGSVTTGANGTIDMTVNTTDVGSPTPATTLYSVTSYALVHAAPTLPLSGGTTTQSVSDFPAVATALPAYNVMPLSPSAAGGGAGSGTPAGSSGSGAAPAANAIPNTSASRPSGAPMALAGVLLLGAGILLRRSRRRRESAHGR